MPRKPIELPPAVARAFVNDMRAFLAEENAIKRDQIAARQLHALKQHYTGKLRLFDVKEMFLQMRITLDAHRDNARALNKLLKPGPLRSVVSK